MLSPSASFMEALSLTIAVLLCALIVLRVLVRIVRVSGTSMVPHVYPGDYVLAFPFWPRRLVRVGHVIVFKRPADAVGVTWVPGPAAGREVTADILVARSPRARPQSIAYRIKRVLAVGGDLVCPPTPIIDPYWALAESGPGCADASPIQPGCVFVQGTSDDSIDSRVTGPLKLDRFVWLVVTRRSTHRGQA